MWLNGEFSGFFIRCYTCVLWDYPLWYQFRVFFVPLGSHGDVLMVRTFSLRRFSCLVFVFFLGAPVETVLGMVFNWVHLLELLWVCLHNFHPRRFCMVVWTLLYDGLVLFWMYHPRISFWGGCFVKNIIGISMPHCVNFLVWIVGWKVIYFVVHELNHVCYEWNHL